MKNLPTFTDFINESNNYDLLIKLYNGIQNDYSIQRYSLGWEAVLKEIKKVVKNIPETDDEFYDEILLNSIKITSGNLNTVLKQFAKELSINKDTMNSKYK